MKRYAIILILVVLTSCNPLEGTEAPVTATVKATATPTAPLPTAPVAPTHTAVPTSTSTITPLPTATNGPTATPTIIPTPTETPIPTSPVTEITLAPVTAYTFLKPTSLTHAGDERLFVTEQQGIVRIIRDDQVLSEPFLYIVDRVRSVELEQGLFSIAFHPEYAINGYFYVNYTGLDGGTVIARYQVRADNPDLATSNSEQILLRLAQPFVNHNGGQLDFGPDGYLYVGMGDGGAADDPLGAGQRLDLLLGKLLRLDVDFNPDGYAIPADNPFVLDNDARNEIWAYGLRNPWRFSFDRLTGDMFVADVGQNEWEEIHFQPATSSGGENYGWNIMEGLHCFREDGCDQTGLILPIHEYDHSIGCSVTGGYMYRGPRLPLYGNYFFGEFCSGTITSLFPNGDGSWQAHEVHEKIGSVSSFGEDLHGELYVLTHEGAVFQIRP